MDQSKSSESVSSSMIVMPGRKLGVEFLVGIFAMLGVGSIGLLSVGLGGVQFGSSRYPINVEFDNISGLQNGASVEIGGVPIGEVSAIILKDPTALITLQIDNNVKLKDDDIASIRTKGIIGDRYVKISRGSSDVFLKPGDKMPEMGESIVDIEDLIGKLVHNMSSSKDKESE